MIISNGVNINGGVIFLAPPPSTLAGSLQFTGGATSHSSSYLSLSSGLSITGGPYTIEGWIYLPNFTQAYGILGATSDYALSLFIANNNTFSSDSYGGHGSFSYTVPTMNINTWYYFALTRNSSNQETLFLGSTPGGIASRSSTGVITNNINYFTSSNSTTDVGTYYGQGWPGYLTNLRITVGSNVYDPTQTSIPVPSTSLTSTGNTKYLMLGNAVTTDGSGTQTVTKNGTITQTSVKPF
jgi:hypothetical protein